MRHRIHCKLSLLNSLQFKYSSSLLIERQKLTNSVTPRKKKMNERDSLENDEQWMKGTERNPPTLKIDKMIRGTLSLQKEKI